MNVWRELVTHEWVHDLAYCREPNLRCRLREQYAGMCSSWLSCRRTKMSCVTIRLTWEWGKLSKHSEEMIDFGTQNTIWLGGRLDFGSQKYCFPCWRVATMSGHCRRRLNLSVAWTIMLMCIYARANNMSLYYRDILFKGFASELRTDFSFSGRFLQAKRMLPVCWGPSQQLL